MRGGVRERFLPGGPSRGRRRDHASGADRDSRRCADPNDAHAGSYPDANSYPNAYSDARPSGQRHDLMEHDGKERLGRRG